MHGKITEVQFLLSTFILSNHGNIYKNTIIHPDDSHNFQRMEKMCRAKSLGMAVQGLCPVQRCGNFYSMLQTRPFPESRDPHHFISADA